jgi:hypothetical protein
MGLYKVYNGPMPTAASQAAVTTSTAIKTLLQVKPGATQIVKVREWGISFDGAALATPGICELCETDVAATVTAFAAADITKFDAAALLAGDPTTNILSVGTAASGYTASAEGAIAAVRQGDVQQIMGMNQWAYQFVVPDGGFLLQPAKFGRIRVKFAAAINAICWMLLET